MKIFRILILSACICLGSGAYAQQQDAVFSAGLSIEKKFTKQFSATLYPQCAFNENYSELQYYFIRMGLNYRLNRNITVAGSYQFLEYRNLQNFYQPRYIYNADLLYSKSKGDFRLGLRARYSFKTYGVHLQSADNYRPNKNYVRLRCGLRYAITDNDNVGLSEEMIYRLDTKNETEVWRTVLNFTHTFNLHNKLELRYSIFDRVNRTDPDTDFITGILYYYKF